MDQEGPEWCRENLATIVEWMREEAKRRKIPFFKPLVQAVVKKAIRSAEHKQRILER